MSRATLFAAWLDATFAEPARQMRWSFLPPLMVYFAAGVSGLTGIVGAFFVKEHLDLSAAFVAGLGFWAGLPWVLKMPLGHLVDLYWRWKGWMVVLGAGMIALSLAIMLGLVTERDAMAAWASPAAWFVAATILAPAGYVVQDVVADAMTVEAVPSVDLSGEPIAEDRLKALHTTMQTLGRFAIISGSVAVGAANVLIFRDTAGLPAEVRLESYATVYRLAFLIPLISVTGVALAEITRRRRIARMRREGAGEREIAKVETPEEPPEADWRIFAGGGAFVLVSVGLGLSDAPWAAEAVFFGTMAVVLYLIRRLAEALPRDKARMLFGTAAIVFAFRAVPLPGPGLTWFEIDVLGFDEQFLAVLSVITSALALVGLVMLRPLMARWSIAAIVALLSVVAGVMALPNIGLYYGIQEFTAAWTGGVVDARFIAILDTAVESPLGQVAMIPMLAWIARNAPRELKATFFAVMASFTNLALSASQLATKHVNRLWEVTRETQDTGADYSELGEILIFVAVVSMAAPLLTIAAVQLSRYRTTD
ncbi:MAG: hypothetical protein R6V44_06690 [Paracoccaceae bacterium]